MRIAIVAGEASGDYLAADLMAALTQREPEVQFVGIAGPAMRLAGCDAWFDMEELAVMGLVEVVRHLPKLYRLQQRLVQRLLAQPPDLFIGVDAPDFNLPLAAKLKKAGIRTVHYTSPSVWAWRRYRLRHIAKAVDLMLCLFPFEPALYAEHSVPAQFVGHPLADAIAPHRDSAAARQRLGITTQAKHVIALLPGSRAAEVARMGPLLLQTAQACLQGDADLLFLVPLVNQASYQQFRVLQQELAPDLPCQLFLGQARDVLAAAEVGLITSGTATLEALLCGCPMVIAYQMPWLTYVIAKRLVHIPFVGLPNILAERLLVPEFIQQQATAQALAGALLAYLADPARCAALREAFLQIHYRLRQHASARAADAIGARFLQVYTASPSRCEL